MSLVTRLYVAQSTGSLVKVGKTDKPQARGRWLSKQFKEHNTELQSVFFSHPVPGSWVEFAFISVVRHELGRPVVGTKEWFHNNAGLDLKAIMKDLVNKSREEYERGYREGYAAKRAKAEAMALERSLLAGIEFAIK